MDLTRDLSKSMPMRLRIDRVMRVNMAIVSANDLGRSTLKPSMALVFAHAVPTTL
jgi:hypothetical protein